MNTRLSLLACDWLSHCPIRDQHRKKKLLTKHIQYTKFLCVVHFYFYFNSMSLQDVKDHGYSIAPLSVNYYDLREKIVQSMSRYTVRDGFLFISVGHFLLQFISSEFSPIHSIHKCSLHQRTLINTVYVNLTYNCTHTKSLRPT